MQWDRHSLTAFGGIAARQGHIIASIDENEESYRELEMPTFSTIRKE
jgi:hypothetical protein